MGDRVECQTVARSRRMGETRPSDVMRDEVHSAPESSHSGSPSPVSSSSLSASGRAQERGSDTGHDQIDADETEANVRSSFTVWTGSIRLAGASKDDQSISEVRIETGMRGDP